MATVMSAPMSSRRVLPPDLRRAELLAAARDEFATRGYHTANVGTIVARVGCARGTFYNYFENKRAVFSAVVADMMDEVTAVIVPIDVTRPIPVQVRDNIERITAAVMAHDVARVLFSEAPGIDGEGDAALREFYSQALERVERALRTGQALGVVREGDLTLLARCLLGLFKEPVFQARLFGEPLDPAHLAGTVLDLLGNGLIARPE